MLEQHELNLVIIKKQSRLTKISIATAFIGVIVGSILTAYLPKALSPDKPSVQKASIEKSTQLTTETTGKMSLKHQDRKDAEPTVRESLIMSSGAQDRR